MVQELQNRGTSDSLNAPGRPMQVVNRLLCVIALIMAVGGSVALYIHAQDSLRKETMASLMTSQRVCVCQGTPHGQAGFSPRPRQCPVRGGPI